MIVCKECNNDVYLIQRALKEEADFAAYHCWYCERSLGIEEVKFN